MATKSQVLDDNVTYIVEKVLKHDIVNSNGKEMLNLLIKRFGYEKPELMGMNISLKRNGEVQKYLKANDLKRFGHSEHEVSELSSEPLKKQVRFSSFTYSDGELTD